MIITLPDKSAGIKGQGAWINADGYIQLTRVPHRKKYYHRVKAAQAMEASGLQLTSEMEVDHLCGNRQCPCPNFHLLILPAFMADKLNAGKRPRFGGKNHIGVGGSDVSKNSTDVPGLDSDSDRKMVSREEG